MLVSMIIVFREMMEAGLIIGIVLAATEGISKRGSWTAGGVALGTAGALLVAAFAATLSDALDGIGHEVFTACILWFAVIMLTWHVAWMSQHAKELAREMREVGQAVRTRQRSLAALTVVVAVAVMREGSEVALFLFGIAASSQTSPAAMAAGGACGLLLAAGLSWLLYRGLVAIPLKRLFTVTNWLIALLAAGMAGQAAAVLHAADLVPGWGEQVWDTSALLRDDGVLGRTLHALVGYSARPSGIQVAAWLATLLMLGFITTLARRRSGKLAAVSAVLVAALLVRPALADEGLMVTFQAHHMEPTRIEVPAHVRFKLTIKNADDTAEEFESSDLNREKLVTAGQTTTVSLGPLEPGEYKVFGDFHQDTAQAVLVAK